MSIPKKIVKFEIADISKMSEEDRVIFLTKKSFQGIIKGEPETPKEYEQFIINFIYMMEYEKMKEKQKAS